jgi:demethylmenaquinone methyltransferase/2-methoxy-6-polyprenyl-1,4-benzoquinol methylase
MLPLPVKPQKYALDDKEKNVQAMFTSIARKYDLNNTLLSGGLHNLWKNRVVRLARLPQKGVILDIASGTCDIAIKLAARAGEGSRVIASDLNFEMLRVGSAKIRARGLSSRIFPLLGRAENLQFKNNSVDLITVGFGMRNFSNLQKALAEVYRVLKPGGEFICLEFSKPVHLFWRKLYDFYSFVFLPKIGQWVSKDQTGVYQYLPDSIRKFPDQEKLKQMMVDAGFKDAAFINLTGGIVAIHSGHKPAI